MPSIISLLSDLSRPSPPERVRPTLMASTSNLMEGCEIVKISEDHLADKGAKEYELEQKAIEWARRCTLSLIIITVSVFLMIVITLIVKQHLAREDYKVRGEKIV